MADDWVSEDTETKERHVHGILWTHATICKGIATRQRVEPYLYVDLHAGRGHLQYRGRSFNGSPLIARDILAATGMPYQAMHYEANTEQAAMLAEALWVPTTLLDAADVGSHPINVERCEDGFARWLKGVAYQPNRYGVVYSDPVRDEIPHELLNKTARALPRVDLLAYVMANQYKRRRGIDERLHGAQATRPFLADHIKAVNKRYVLIREPIGKWESTFALWTDWDGYPVWEKAGFHRLDSARGQRVLDRLNLAKRKRHSRDNTPLWEDEDAA